ncbi:MAG: hypothetical protein PVJ09_02420 [Candidatus Woesebacteria bacterium]
MNTIRPLLGIQVIEGKEDRPQLSISWQANPRIDFGGGQIDYFPARAWDNCSPIGIQLPLGVSHSDIIASSLTFWPYQDRTMVTPGETIAAVLTMIATLNYAAQSMHRRLSHIVVAQRQTTAAFFESLRDQAVYYNYQPTNDLSGRRGTQPLVRKGKWYFTADYPLAGRPGALEQFIVPEAARLLVELLGMETNKDWKTRFASIVARKR